MAAEIYMLAIQAHFLFKCRGALPTNHVSRDAGAAKQRRHLLLVNTLPAPPSAVGIDVHQEALRSVGCKVKEGYEMVIKKVQCLPSLNERASAGLRERFERGLRLMETSSDWLVPKSRRAGEINGAGAKRGMLRGSPPINLRHATNAEC